MTRIVILPPELASQIAAGEVVERPASAVKELIENALDAGATRCDVEIDAGGIRRIRVADDGVGMTEADLRLSVERHATSKLATLADLDRISSFGFRGEALPSLASVSRLSISTRSPACDEGAVISLEGGELSSCEPVGRPPGTTVEVRDLFFNVPARRKFLRASGTESGHVGDVVESAALARPDVTFTFGRDGRRVRELLRVTTLEERVAQVFTEEALAPCRGQRGPLAIEAFLSRPERARSGGVGLKLFVNTRPVRDRSLALTVAQAYGSVLERGRYPRGAVYLTLPPELVDVNVHPRKSEVRFADPRAVQDALYSVLSKALASAFSLPPGAPGRWVALRDPPATAPAPAQPAAPTTAAAAAEVAPDPWGLADAAPPAAAPASSSTHAIPNPPAQLDGEPPTLAVRDSATSPIRPRPEVKWSSLRFVAQVRQTYLLCETNEGLYVLDQHAAAERVAFDKLRRAYRDRNVAAQALLFPLTIDVSPEEAEFVEAHGEALSEAGLQLRARGEQVVSIHAVPKLLQRASPERLVRDLLSEMMRTGGRGFSDAVDLALATMACHGSVRAGDPLSAAEATALLLALDQADFAGHCPHGRPVVTFTSWAELDRKVGRR